MEKADLHNYLKHTQNTGMTRRIMFRKFHSWIGESSIVGSVMGLIYPTSSSLTFNLAKLSPA